MIKHIVMWKLKSEAEGRTAAENALEHVKISSYCKKVRETRVACDYIID